jgi:acyl transferase domain-containing protein/glutamate-1-semialdehyde aminotransferase/NAD(P)-dependent dehydrogenase (short-subunit alcohol dehydrogenase family)
VFGAMPVGVDLPCYPWRREEFWLKGSQPTPVTTPGVVGQVVWEQCEAEGTSNEAPGSVVVFQPAGCPANDIGRFLASEGYAVDFVEVDSSAPVQLCQPRAFGLFWVPPTLPLAQAVMGLAAILRQIDENQLTLTGLAVVTSGAVPMDEDRCGSELYGLWGMVRAARTELKGLPIHLWDVASADGERAWRGLVDEMGRSTPELELVIDGGRWRPVLTPYEEAPTTASGRDCSEGWTLVTGAGGGLAQSLVGKLAAQGCRRFILVGRTAPLRGLEALQERSDCELVAVEIELGMADAANRLADLSPQLSGVRHVYHLAGALADATIARLDADQCEAVFRPKVAGLRQLASALGDLRRLKTFVCYSSAASVLGHPGQAFYAAANAFMDHFVFRLRTMGAPAQSVSWGPWADAGMAARIATSRSYLQQRSLNTTTGLEAIDRILASNLPHALVMPDIAALLPAPRPSLPDVAAALWGAVREEAVPSGSADVPKLVSFLVAGLLGLPVEQVALDKSFSDLGLDSLNLVTLKNEINRKFGTTLPTSALYNHPTISELSQRIAERHGSGGETVGERRADLRVSDSTCAAMAASAGRVPVVDDIAVVGIGCRLPREIRGAEQLWDALCRSYSGIGPLPKSRIDLERYGNGDRQAEEKIYVRKGGFLDACVDEFDPPFFSLSPRSAEAMDPQHRLLLTVAWEAIEHAGLSRRRLSSGKTGVYMGLGTDDFAYLVHNKGDHITADRVLGANRGVGVGRIAFCLGLKGPAIAVDTTCSSSLTAAHLAIQGLRAGDCDVALAGGVHLILTPENMLARCRLGVLSASDRLSAFDNDGDGFVQGEGCGVVVLRRLADAVADGDNILAVIEASALNHNGGGNGIQAPNGCAQAALINECLEAAECDPNDVLYVETHGTGTKLGDPIEFEGLASSYGARRNPDHPLLIGSIKTNFGHLEPAAGIVSFIKAVLIADRSEIPPQLNFRVPNEHIPWEEAAVRVADKLQPLPCPPGRTPRIAVSSFGISGANAHIILRRHQGAEKAAKTMSHYCLPISATGAEALAAVTAATGGLVARRPDELPSICYTAAVGRSHYRDRIAVTGADHLQIAAALKTAQPAGSRNPPRTAIAFSGQGAQMAQAGADLYEHFPVFRRVIDRCHDLLLEKDGNRNLRQLMFAADDEVLRRTENAQPVIYAFGWAVLSLLRSVGVEPQAYIGHSVGEFIAAAAAGVWSFEEGFSLVVDRGQLMARLPSGGEMLHIDQDADTVAGLLAELRSCVDIAAHNSSVATVVAGEAGGIAALIEACKARNYSARKLPVSHAFHSRLLDPVLEEWRARLQRVSTVAAGLPIASNRHGRMAMTEFGSAGYWVEHMRAPVLFRQGVEALAVSGVDLVIEVGPRPILTGHILRDVPAMRTAAPGSSYRSLCEFMAEYYLLGGDLRWEGFYPDPGAHRKTEFPGHPLKRGRFNHTLEHLKTEKENMLCAPNPATPDRSDNREAVVDRLRSIFSALLGIDAAALDADATFLSLGADSYVLVSALSKIKQAWSCQIQLRSLFEEHNSINKLASYIEPSGAADPVGAQDLGAPRLSDLDSVATDDAPVASANRPDDPLPLPDFKPPAFASVVPPRAVKPQQEAKGLSQRPGRSDLSSGYLQRFVSEYRTRTKGSLERAAASRSHLCNNRRSAASEHPEAQELSYPIVARSSRGSRFWDVDGNEYIDLALGYGACLFGHKPDFIDAALRKQLELGYQIGPESELAGENASMIAELTGLDRVLFNNSGSEAIFTAIRLARAATGRTKIVVFQNSYHGHSDEVLVVPDLDNAFFGARPMVAGVPAEKVGAVVMLPYGGDRALDYLRRHASELAAVLVEPVQNRRPDYHPKEFLRELRHITAESRTPLIFDEVLVGFRVAPGGAAEWFGVKPDIATYGKVVGGGLPLGVVAGARWCMDAVDNGPGTPSGQKTYTAGTFCKHPLAMAAANAVLKKLSAEGKEITSHLNERAKGLVTILNQSFTAERVPVRVYNFGSFFRFSQADNLSFLFQPLELQLFVYHLVHNGVYVWEGGTCFISTEHSDDDMDRIIGVTHNAIRSMKRGGFWSDEASAARMPAAGRKGSGLSRAVTTTVDA